MLDFACDLIEGCLLVLVAVVAVWTLGHWANSLVAHFQMNLLPIGRCV